MQHLNKKIIALTGLGLAAYFAITCPCAVYLACHKELYGAALVMAAYPLIVM